MTEMIKVLNYFKVPHPFKRNEEVVIVDEENYEQNLKECYEITKKKEGIPIFRFFIKAAGEPKEKDVEDIKNFEKKFREKKKGLLNGQKLGLWISLAVSFIVGYIFYLSFCGLHFTWLTYPINYIFETFFNRGVDKWVVWTVVFLFPFGAACRIFLPLRIPKLGTFGNFGAFYQLKRQSEILKVLDFFGKNRKRVIRLRISNYVSSLKKNDNTNPALLERIEERLKAILKLDEGNSLSSWNKDLDELLEELALLSEGGEFSWLEVEKLSRFKEELLAFGLTNFEVGKLEIISPESPLISPEVFSKYSAGKIALDLQALGVMSQQKARNLRDFLRETEDIRERIYQDSEKLERTESEQERKRVLERLVSNLEILTVICSSCHFGENPNIPQEKRKGALLSFYNEFYQKLGVGLIPLKKKTSKIKISQEPEKPSTSRTRKLLLWSSETPIRGLILTLVIVFLVASTFSFYALNASQVGCETKTVFGTVDPNTLEHRLLGEQLVFKEYGQGIFQVAGHDIFWYLPEPLTKPRIVDFQKEQSCDVYHIVITRNVSVSLWDKMKRFGQGSFGNTGYEGLKFTITFSPKTKDWVGYDFDGKGSLRLSRDLATLFRNWQSLEMESMYPQDEEEQNYVFDVYLVELAKSGELTKYIESLLRGDLVQGFAYGTNLDTIRGVYNLFVDRIDKDIENVKDSNLSAKEKAEKIKELELVKDNLKATLENYSEGFSKEKANLVNNPQLLKKLLDGLKNKEDISLLLKEFPNLQTSIVNYVYYSYANEKFLAAVSGELGKELQDKMFNDLRVYILGQKISEIVEIKNISVEKFFMTEYDYYMKVSQPMSLLSE